MPELPEVETVRQGLAKWVTGRTHRHRRGAAPAGDPPPPARRRSTSPTCSPGRTVGDVHRRGKYLWLPLDDERRAHRPPRHVRPAADAAGRAPAETAPAGPVHASPTAARELRFVDQRTFGGLAVSRGRRRAARRDRAHRAATRSTRRSSDEAFVARAAPQADRRQAGAARPDPDLRRRQHLRRRGAVAGQAARRPADRPADPAGGAPAARRTSATCSTRRSGRAAPASTRCTSTSTARAATSTAR